MALAAIRRESAGAMVGRCCFLEILRVAAIALGGKPEAVELAYRAYFVAGVAIHHSMRTDQGKAILMLVDVVDRYLPTVGVVAQCAFGAVLTPMQIRMAVLTLIRRVGEF